MANYVQNTRTYEKWDKEGRGQGQKETYKPWLTVFDVPSEGRSHRIPSFKLKREITAFSDLEAARVYQLENDSSVIDYNEQYPLNRDRTLAIANRPEFAFTHLTIREFPIVMTTDFVVHYADRIEAEQIKPTSKLDNDRVLEKLKIEQAYWEEQGIKFLIKTEKDFPLDLRKNLQWLHQPQWYQTPDHLLRAFAAEFMELFTRYPNDRLADIAEYLELNTKLARLQEGNGLMLLRQLFAKHYLTFDLMVYFTRLKGRDISFNKSKVMQGRVS